MGEYIKSKDVVQIAVITLMNGVKCKAAFPDKETGKLKLKNITTISQFLNSKKGRTRITPKIIQLLSDTVRYYIENSDLSHEEICSKAIIFVYAISRIDLTYTHHYLSNKQYSDIIKDHIINIIERIFQTLKWRESIERSELENIVYESIYGNLWRFIYNKQHDEKGYFIRAKGTSGLYECSSVYDIGRTQIEDKRFFDYEYMLIKYGNYIEFEEEISVEEFTDTLLAKGIKAKKRIENLISYINDIAIMDNPEDFFNKYKYLYNKSEYKLFTGKDWKKSCLSIEIRNVMDSIDNLITAVRITNEYMTVKYLGNHYIKRIKEAGCSKNFDLKDWEWIEKYKKPLIEKIEYLLSQMQLQIDINKHLGTFGCCCYRMNSVKKKNISDTHELIVTMYRYLFYSTDYGNTGKSNNNDKSLYYYLIGRHKNFNTKIKCEMLDRIIKHIDRDENKKIYSYFMNLIWQFYYYAFGIDFFMLREIENGIKWYNLIEKTLDMAVEGKSVSEIEENLRQEYFVLWSEFDNMKGYHKQYRFLPEEIELFRKYDSIGYTFYNYMSDSINQFKPDPEKYNKIIDLLIHDKIKEYLEKVKKSITLIKELLSKKRVSSLKEGFSKYDHVDYDENNWKCRLYTIHTKELVYYTIRPEELDTLMRYIAAYYTDLKITERHIGKFQEIDDQYRIISNVMSEYTKKMKTDKAGLSENEICNIMLNQELLARGDIRYLYKMLELMYKYQKYCVWSMDRLRRYYTNDDFYEKP